MTRTSILAQMQRDSLKLPYKLQLMVAKYIEAINEGTHTPSKLCKLGAGLLNDHFVKCDAGDVEALEAMRRDHIDANALAAAGDLFIMAQLQFEEEGT